MSNRTTAPSASPRAVIAASLLNGLEIYDFSVFSFFAAMIGSQFFPAQNPLDSLLFAVGTFGVGFFVRPLGAFLIGPYAERVGGRAAMATTGWMMALGTLAIGACPPASRIGLAAPIIVLVGRVLQGLAAGGEIGVSGSFVLEAGPARQRGLRFSWQLASQGAGALLGSSLGVALSSVLSADQLDRWGWRLAFLLGLAVVPLCMFFRRRIASATSLSARHPRGLLRTLTTRHTRTLVLATLMMASRTVPVYFMYFLPGYMTHVRHLPALTGFICASVSALWLMAVSPLSGWLADRQARRKPVVLGIAVLLTLLVYPMSALLAHAPGLPTMLIGVSVISILVALGASASTVMTLDALPAPLHASGLAISYALGVALFGGTAQFVVTALIKWTGNPLAAAWYVTGACLLGLIATALFKED